MDVNRKNKTASRMNKVELYKSQMKEVDFLAKHLEDAPEIFDVRSEKCILFLIKTFTVLNSNLHHLSLLGHDSIGQELAKAASNLQIYPCNRNEKLSDIFHYMNDIDIHNFWMRFLKLCKINSSYIDSNPIDKIAEDSRKFHSMFCNVSETVHYFNHDMSIMDPKRLKGVDIQEEIKTWLPSVHHKSLTNDCVKYNCKELSLQEKNLLTMDPEELIAVVNDIKKTTDFSSLNYSDAEFTYEDFFINFSESVKIVKNFRENLNIVSSFVLQDVIDKTSLHENSYWSGHNPQIQRCNNIIRDILVKDKPS